MVEYGSECQHDFVMSTNELIVICQECRKTEDEIRVEQLQQQLANRDARIAQLGAMIAVKDGVLERIAAERPLSGPLNLTDLDMQDIARQALSSDGSDLLELVEIARETVNVYKRFWGDTKPVKDMMGALEQVLSKIGGVE